MTQQYLRQLSLIVADPAGRGIELGSLRVQFEVRRGDLQTPNTCDVTVFNLSAQTANRIAGPEFTQLALKVGYRDQQPQLIFRGSIKQARIGREDQKTTYLALTAADGDEAYNFSALALTLAAGSTPTDVVQQLIRAMTGSIAGSPTGATGGEPVSQGYLPQLPQNGCVRGRTFYGMTRDEMRNFAADNDCTWNIEDGKVNLIPLTSPMPGPAVLITPSTGLIGVPEQTQNGLQMTVLLNPSIRIGQTVKLDSTDVNRLRFGLDIPSFPLNFQLSRGSAKLNADGLYYVMRADHVGDTRGEPWYTLLTCLAVDASVPHNGATFVPANTATAIPRY